MEIYFFTRYEDGTNVAGIKEDGKRVIRTIFSSGKDDYVFSDSGLLKFSDSQQKAYSEFLDSGKSNMEYFDNPLV
jgi:hypothetical protein